ncbi:MAG: hypothetical protein QOD06_402 [Candidatus Binatota bacterium]|jgi:hypothetical protein|nr:hypothetical protein [Candidatus Binatota bacterium]
MERVLGTVLALLFLAWGGASLYAGIGAGRGDWIVLGAGIALFGCTFLPAIAYLWRAGPEEGRGHPEG